MNNDKTDFGIHLNVRRHTPRKRRPACAAQAGGWACCTQMRTAADSGFSNADYTVLVAVFEAAGDGCGPSNSAAGLAAPEAAVRDHGPNAERLTAGQVAPASARQSLLRHCETPRPVLDKNLSAERDRGVSPAETRYRLTPRRRAHGPARETGPSASGAGRTDQGAFSRVTSERGCHDRQQATGRIRRGVNTGRRPPGTRPRARAPAGTDHDGVRRRPAKPGHRPARAVRAGRH
jgi:hypothetical protein